MLQAEHPKCTSQPRNRTRAELPAQRAVRGPARFCLYADRTSPAAHRSRLVIALGGLSDVVAVQLVDGPEARPEPGARPLLWDLAQDRLVGDGHPALEKELAVRFAGSCTTGVDLYPAEARAEIDELHRWLGRVVDQGPSRLGPAPVAGGGRAGADARALLNEAFARLDRILSGSRYLVGDRITLADVRLWVNLVRFGADAGRAGRISTELQRFPSLWAYAQNLYEREEFRSTTEPELLRRPALS